jgi:type IV pilus assembly protein PilQ
MEYAMQTNNPLIRVLLSALVTFSLVPAAQAASQDQAAGNQIEKIEQTQLQDGKLVVKIHLKTELKAAPGGFAVANPPRVALDLGDTSNGTGKNSHEVNQGALRSIALAQAGNRTRVVLNLVKSVGYSTQLEGKMLLVTLNAGEMAGAAASESVPATQFAEAKPGTENKVVRAVDFRRGRDGEGRIIVELADSNTGIDIKQQGKGLVVDILETTIPRGLERRLDVVDFGTPVQSVDTFAQGANVKLIIEPKGEWEHSAYQTDRQLIIEVKPKTADAGKGVQKGYVGEKLSLNFQNIDVRSVLQVIADFTGINIVTSDSVTGSLTLRLKDVPWDQALDIILKSKGLAMRQSGNVIRIAPTDELASKEKLELEARQQINELEPTQTEDFQVKYQKAADVAKLLSDPLQRILSKRGSAVVDVRTNKLFVKDTPTNLEEVRKLLAKIDVPVRQVMIESRIVEANDNFSKSLGARLGFHDLSDTAASGATRPQVRLGGQLEDSGAHTGQTVVTPTFNNNAMNVLLPSAGAGGFRAGVLSMILFNQAATRFLNLELSALQADGKGKVISNPRVVTSDNVEATIEQGTEIPYLQASSSGATSVSFKKAVLSLKVKPQITPDDNVIMDLQVNKDSPGTNTFAGPAINTKNIKTNALVENGGTVVIGGIYEQTESETVTKVPVFGDIPVVGIFFRNRDKTDNKSEMLVFITPKIIKENLR